MVVFHHNFIFIFYLSHHLVFLEVMSESPAFYAMREARLHMTAAERGGNPALLGSDPLGARIMCPCRSSCIKSRWRTHHFISFHFYLYPLRFHHFRLRDHNLQHTICIRSVRFFRLHFGRQRHAPLKSFSAYFFPVV